MAFRRCYASLEHCMERVKAVGERVDLLKETKSESDHRVNDQEDDENGGQEDDREGENSSPFDIDKYTNTAIAWLGKDREHC